MLAALGVLALASTGFASPARAQTASPPTDAAVDDGAVEDAAPADVDVPNPDGPVGEVERSTDGSVPAAPVEGRTPPMPTASPAPGDGEDDTMMAPAPEETSSGDEPAAEDEFGLRGIAELGFLAVLRHNIRLGQDGTYLDYITDANQSNLYFFLRLTVELDIWRQHHVRLLYQPLDISSQASLPRDLLIDGLVYPAGTPVTFRYGFPFYRVSWDFDVLDDPREELRFGLGLQIRNATIEFTSQDGTLYRSRTDVGPVPLLRLAMRFPIVDGFWFAFDADGFYAPISVINGSDNEVVGAILDTSLQVGWRFLPHVDGFLAVRYLGGGAAGSGTPSSTSDGYQENWLHFLTVSVGAVIDTRP